MLFIIPGNLIFNIFRGPLELCLGIVVGLVIGGALWYIPAAGSVSTLYLNFLSYVLFFLK